MIVSLAVRYCVRPAVLCPVCVCHFRMDSDDLSQWQSEFRGQIRALRHWLNSMEMRLPPLDPTVSFYCFYLCLLPLLLHFSLNSFPLLNIPLLVVLHHLPSHMLSLIMKCIPLNMGQPGTHTDVKHPRPVEMSQHHLYWRTDLWTF